MRFGIVKQEIRFRFASALTFYYICKLVKRNNPYGPTIFFYSSRHCHICHNISDSDTCTICGDPSRDASTLCVVENVKEVMVVENTRQFHGLYHVLGGVISPMDGIGPADLEIESLVNRVASGGIKEVILALSATMEGDTTNFYIFRKLAPFDVKITIIARGVSIGGELEYTDEITLGRSILNRTLFSESFKG